MLNLCCGFLSEEGGGGKAGAVTAVKMIVVLVGPYFNFYTV